MTGISSLRAVTVRIHITSEESVVSDLSQGTGTQHKMKNNKGEFFLNPLQTG